LFWVPFKFIESTRASDRLPLPGSIVILGCYFGAHLSKKDTLFMSDTDITFDSLALCEPIHRALRERDYTTPSPIQAQTIPYVLEGHDVMGCAQTGTGKTAAFALPTLNYLQENPAQTRRCAPRVLVIAPTRELALQIHESFEGYGRYLPFKSAVIFGGVGQNPQIQAMRRGPEILVATPGRLLDLIDQGHVNLKHLEVFVIDEADRMLDMGFIHDVKRIIKLLPSQRQSLFFSATMPKAIIELAGTILKDPKQVQVTPSATTVEKISQSVCYVDKMKKKELLVKVLQDQKRKGLTIVFTATKHGANRLVEYLSSHRLRAAAIHGNKSQTARQRALDDFRNGRIHILVATDIAARGIDVKGIDLVINYDIPNEPDSYVHRIGRTARAGAEGKAITFCDQNSHKLLHDIERNIRMRIPVWKDQPYHNDNRAQDQGRPNRASRQDPSKRNDRSVRRRRRGGQGRRRNPQGAGAR